MMSLEQDVDHAKAQHVVWFQLDENIDHVVLASLVELPDDVDPDVRRRRQS
jgi:hypothetical protein